jgi:hypothetical protein
VLSFMSVSVIVEIRSFMSVFVIVVGRSFMSVSVILEVRSFIIFQFNLLHSICILYVWVSGVVLCTFYIYFVAVS